MPISQSSITRASRLRQRIADKTGAKRGRHVNTKGWPRLAQIGINYGSSSVVLQSLTEEQLKND
ncbi:MAG: hypothetical protein IJ761_03785 [Bacteroidales bacterium]|nr:hypothetical protein [Bacteroidales bacterium]